MAKSIKKMSDAELVAELKKAKEERDRLLREIEEQGEEIEEEVDDDDVG